MSAMQVSVMLQNLHSTAMQGLAAPAWVFWIRTFAAAAFAAACIMTLGILCLLWSGVSNLEISSDMAG